MSMTTCSLRVAAPRSTARASRRTSVQVQASAWFPGQPTPAHLEGAKMAGNYGFDPLNLGTEPAQLSWFVQAELQHARWAMLGVAGILVPELMGGLSPPTTNYDWFTAGSQSYNIPTPTLVGIQFFLMAWVEIRRLQDIRAPGSASQDPIFASNKLPAGEVGYPGGPFDFMGFSKGGDLASLKQKEIKNGRLAMFAFLGFVAQHAATGKSPLAALGEHLSDPWAKNFASNGVSFPLPVELSMTPEGFFTQ